MSYILRTQQKSHWSKVCVLIKNICDSIVIVIDSNKYGVTSINTHKSKLNKKK